MKLPPNALFTLILVMSLTAMNATSLDARPDFVNVAYGENERQKLDIYLPHDKGDGPFPVAIFIHGGGWVHGNKWGKVNQDTLNRFLDAGCAFAAINYRLLKHARQEGVTPLVLVPLYDARQALQFVRLHAAEWDLDPHRIVIFGGSAGAYSSLWVALSSPPETPDPADPLAAVSTEVLAVGGANAQTTLDPKVMREWVGPELTYGGHAFDIPSFRDFLKRREEFAEWYPKLSPASLVQASSPPIYLEYKRGLEVPEDDPQYYPHSPQFGIHFTEIAKERGATCYLSYLGHPEQDYDGDMVDFLIAALKQ